MSDALKPVVFLVLLTGCVGAAGEPYLGMPGSPAWFATASNETIAAHFRQQCQSYGFAPGTEAMAICIQNSANDSRGRASNRAAMGMALAAASQQQSQPAPVQMPVRCNSNRNPWNGQVTTTCQ